MNIIWKPIKNYESLYEVSNTGLVKSCYRQINNESYKRSVPEKILKPSLNGRGYQQVVLYKDGIPKTFKVHTLVANTFLDKFSNNLTVNHKDENKLNNHVSNLEWLTIQDNLAYSMAKVYEFTDPSGNYRQIKNLSKFCLEHNLSDENMHKVLRGLRKQHKGWTAWHMQ